jgi:hypothetical protein
MNFSQKRNFAKKLEDVFGSEPGTRRRIAKEINADYGAVCSWFNGRVGPSPKNLKKLQDLALQDKMNRWKDEHPGEYISESEYLRDNQERGRFIENLPEIEANK